MRGTTLTHLAEIPKLTPSDDPSPASMTVRAMANFTTLLLGFVYHPISGDSLMTPNLRPSYLPDEYQVCKMLTALHTLDYLHSRVTIGVGIAPCFCRLQGSKKRGAPCWRPMESVIATNTMKRYSTVDRGMAANSACDDRGL